MTYGLKTAPTEAAVATFIDAVEHPVRRADAQALSRLMADVTGQPAVMWGPTIIGFGRYHYRHASGHEGDMCRVGFSPRKANLALYLGGFDGFDDLLARLGKHKRAVACLYVSKLADVDPTVLEEIVRRSYAAATDADRRAIRSR